MVYRKPPCWPTGKPREPRLSYHVADAEGVIVACFNARANAVDWARERKLAVWWSNLDDSFLELEYLPEED